MLAGVADGAQVATACAVAARNAPPQTRAMIVVSLAMCDAPGLRPSRRRHAHRANLTPKENLRKPEPTAGRRIVLHPLATEAARSYDRGLGARESGATTMQTTSQVRWDSRAIALTGVLWAILFAGAWLLGHDSSASTTADNAIAVNSGLSTSSSSATVGPAVPGLAAVPSVPALAFVKPVAPARRHRTVRHARAAHPPRVAVASTAPVAPVRRSTTVAAPVVSRPVTPVTRPVTPTTTPTHTTPPPTTTHSSPPPTGTGTVSGGG